MSERRNSGRQSEKSTTRRSFARSIAAGGALLMGTSVGSASSTQSNRGPDKEDFRVEGKQIFRRKVRPKSVELKVTKVSQDLKERYGRKALQETVEHERPNPDEDHLPERSPTEVEQKPWDSYVAAEDEWAALRRTESESSEGVESAYGPRYPSSLPKYYHNNVDGLWELKGPINILSYNTDFSDAGDLAAAIAARGGSWTNRVVDSKRYALYNGTYRRQDAAAATGTFGFRGRKHIRIWDAGDYIMGAAHIDSSYPHKATSYIKAEYALHDVVGGYRDHYRAYNDKKDHNGLVTRLED